MPFKSHLLQLMMNYWDSTDVRSRENPTALESQLLNMAAVEVEDLQLRITRETAQSLQTVPTNIDSSGVYYSSTVPSSVVPTLGATIFNSVQGKVGDIVRTLTTYIDTLPVPARIEVDANSAVAIPNPILFTLIGSGDSQAQVYTVQYVTPGAFPIPNQLTLWVDQPGLNTPQVELTITGEIAPQPAWIAERRKTVEVVTITGEGHAVTRNRWAVIDKIAVRGLPLGTRLRGWSMPFDLPATPDDARPYSTPEDRDVPFPRYWQISSPEGLLKELYRAGGFTGLETVNTYSLNDNLIDVAIEPNTNGLYAVSGNKLYYIDRREVMPDTSLTGIPAEPLYGLQVAYDITKPGSTRYVTLSGVPYAGADNIAQYRYLVGIDSSIGQSIGSSATFTNSILPDGSLGPLNFGWRGGPPQPLSFPMLSIGDYQFRLECQDSSGVVTYDVVPWRNAMFIPLATLDLSDLIDVVAGLAFDSYGTLWIWNGSFAIPVMIHYDGYMYDPDAGKIFLTDNYDSVQIS